MTQPSGGAAPHAPGLPSAGRAARRRRGPLLALLGVVLLAGCGIRTTSVPVDAGPAPSRVSCAVPDEEASASATASASPRGLTARVYLVCSAQVAGVNRSVRTEGLDQLGVAVLLLRELQRKPRGGESSAGFTTAVQGDLAVEGPRRDDPRESLRMSAPLSDLPPFALAQLVCTYAGTGAAAGSGGVLLGGSDDTPVRRFTCTGDLRTDPEAAETAGTAVK
ncbi:hypothetical protein [Actinacidiphila glaucinigra]|uniref:hypothetical protein n=1 Tax=Actinacidiphila glaucinigra TaxID=235986 RepID=UPI002E2F1755|nr:hypothetical protein [Actinacidiphila glaucinigra]